jgi:galactoside O-acetyltransferase
MINLQPTRHNFKHLGKDVTIYDAKLIYPENISIGDSSIIADYCFLYASGKGIEIGNFCNITQHCILQSGGLLKLSDFVGLGPRTTIMAATDDYLGDGFIGNKVFGDKYRITTFKDTIIGRHARIGLGCMILPGVTIGEGCSIGAGSLVLEDMPSWTLCYGSPCKPIKLKNSEIILRMEKEFLKEYYG